MRFRSRERKGVPAPRRAARTLARVPSIAEGRFERDGVELHYLEWKPGAQPEPGPAVVLLHGLSSNARYWERVAAHLPHRHLVALDQRAHGLTGRGGHAPRFPDGFAMAELVDDVRALIAHTGLERPVVAGHSWGATIALEVVGSRPDLASALVFIDGPVQSPANLFTWDDAQKFMQPPLPRYGSMTDAIADSRGDFAEAWGDDLESFVAARVVPDGDALVLTLTAPVRLELLHGLYHSQPDILWSQVAVPALVLRARHGFGRTASSVDDAVATLRKLAPAAEVKSLDSPHDIPLYLPAEVAAEIDRMASAASPEASG